MQQVQDYCNGLDMGDNWNPYVKKLPKQFPPVSCYQILLGDGCIKVRNIDSIAWGNFLYLNESNKSNFPMVKGKSKSLNSLTKESSDQDVEIFVSESVDDVFTKTSSFIKNHTEMFEEIKPLQTFAKHFSNSEINIEEIKLIIKQKINSHFSSDKAFKIINIQFLFEIEGKLNINCDSTYFSINTYMNSVAERKSLNKFPVCDTDGLGRIYPYSRNKDSACLARYGLNGIDAVPYLDHTKVKDINHTTKFLFSKDNKGKLWDKFSGGGKFKYVVAVCCANNKDLLESSVIPSGILTGFDFGTGSADIANKKNNMGMIKAESEKAVRKIKGVASSNPNTQVIFFILGISDKGAVTILQKGDYDMCFLNKKHDIWIQPYKQNNFLSKFEPFPIEYLNYVLNKSFYKNGSMSQNKGVPNINICTIYDAWLNENASATSNLLKHISNYQLPLLIDAGHRLNVSYAHGRCNESKIERMNMFVSILAFSIVLANLLKINLSESYAYKIGQFMSSCEKIKMLGSNQKFTAENFKFMAFSAIYNPRVAIASVSREIFSNYKTILRSKNISHKGSSAALRIKFISQDLNKLEVPCNMSDIDKVLFAMGYCHG